MVVRPTLFHVHIFFSLHFTNIGKVVFFIKLSGKKRLNAADVHCGFSSRKTKSEKCL